MKTERWVYLDSYIFTHTDAQTEYKINDKHMRIVQPQIYRLRNSTIGFLVAIE